MQPQANSSPLSEDVIEALRRAAASKTDWRQAKRDPVGFLRKRHISLPSDVSLTLCDLVVPRSGLVAHGSEIDRPKGDSPAFPNPNTVGTTRPSIPRQPNPVFEQWWESTHMGCPLGTYPHKTTQYHTVVTKQGIVKSGLEWIPDSPGSQYGRFGYTNIMVVPLASLSIPFDVIECLPLYVLHSEP